MKKIQEEHLSIKDFALAAGVSTQSIYKRLSTSLQPYVVEVDNKKMLKKQALKDVYGVESKDELPTVEQESYQHVTNQFATEEIKRLLSEIEKKDKRIEKLEADLEKEREDAKAERERIYSLFDQQQKLAAMDNKKSLEMNEKMQYSQEIEMKQQIEDKQEAEKVEKKQRKSFLSRWFGI